MRYTTRNDAVNAIEVAIEATGVVPDARAEYDVDAIADETIDKHNSEYSLVAHDHFWAAVERHAR